MDEPTVEGFGYQWTKFDQSGVDPAENERLFGRYFTLFPWESLPQNAIGFDLGCGSGRWARLAVARIGAVVGLDASGDALRVAARHAPACPLVRAVAGALPLQSGCMDFGYALGVLHDIPDPGAALAEAVRALKPGAPFSCTSTTHSTTAHRGFVPCGRQPMLRGGR